MATGRRAAESVIRFLNGESLTEGRELKDTWTYETKLDMPTDWENITETRVDMQELDPATRILSLDEVALGYTKVEAEKEKLDKYTSKAAQVAERLSQLKK